MSIESLAREAGVGAGTVSQYERGMGNPTIATLRRLAAVLGIPLIALAGNDETAAEPAPPRDTQANFRPGHVGVVRAAQRRRLVLPGVGPEYDILTPDLHGALVMMQSVFHVGFDNLDDRFSHEGEEVVTLVTGRVEARIGDDTMILEAGDSVTFDASLPHGWRTLGSDDASFYAAITPPTM